MSATDRLRRLEDFLDSMESSGCSFMPISTVREIIKEENDATTEESSSEYPGADTERGHDGAAGLVSRRPEGGPRQLGEG